jgi:Zn-dependent peptidase ImmA (M78 family)
MARKRTTAKLRIPRRVVIGGKRWSVKYVPDLAEKQGAVGLCERHRRTITLDASLTRGEQELTLVHELLHAVWPAGVVGDRTEERLIEKLEEAIHGLMTSKALRRRAG